MHSLDVLDSSQRGESWALEAIAWLGTNSFEPARPLLDNIVNERKGMLVPVWPRPARKAANAALKTLEKNSE